MNGVRKHNVCCFSLFKCAKGSKMNPIINLRLYRRLKLEEITGLKRASIYNRLNPNSKYFDPTFPKPISLSVGNRGSVAWIASEVDAWIETRIAASRSIASF